MDFSFGAWWLICFPVQWQRAVKGGNREEEPRMDADQHGSWGWMDFSFWCLMDDSFPVQRQRGGFERWELKGGTADGRGSTRIFEDGWILAFGALVDDAFPFQPAALEVDD